MVKRKNRYMFDAFITYKTFLKSFFKYIFKSTYCQEFSAIDLKTKKKNSHSIIEGKITNNQIYKSKSCKYQGLTVSVFLSISCQ